jgi:hypothetical protein
MQFDAMRKKMTDRQHYTPDAAANTAQLCRLWTLHVDALDRHLSTDMWALVALTMALITYPLARIVMPAILHAALPDLVRIVFKLI